MTPDRRCHHHARWWPAAALTVLVVSVGATNAAAIDQSSGYPGFCRTSTGVTVVIDFQQLGGPTIVRCNPRSTPGTGLDALIGAGIQVEGVQRWGLAFICRIENRPSAVETIPIAGNSGYRERCIDTPPAAAYWSYWHAGNNCAWTYSQWGVKNRNFTPGGFEGWSFSLNATADANPIPRIAPVRPGTEGGQCTTPDEPGPSGDDPSETLPTTGPGPTVPAPTGSSHDATGSGSSSATGSGSTRGPGGSDPGRTASADDTTGSATRPGASIPGSTESVTGSSSASGRGRGDPGVAGVDPGANVRFTGGAGAPDVRDMVRDQSGASPIAPWIAIGGIIALGGAAGWVEGRRRRRRDTPT